MKIDVILTAADIQPEKIKDSDNRCTTCNKCYDNSSCQWSKGSISL